MGAANPFPGHLSCRKTAGFGEFGHHGAIGAFPAYFPSAGVPERREARSGSKQERAEVADEAEAACREDVHIRDVADRPNIDGDDAMDASFLAG